MKICDISHWQGEINWDKVNNELDLIIFRVSHGKELDKKYLEYTSNCTVPYGVYCYTEASNATEAKEEARLFVAQANKAARKPLFYICDVEHENQTVDNTEEVCYYFLKELKILQCARIGLYINTRYPYMGNALNLCDIMWIPRWGLNDGNIPPVDKQSPFYHDLWQYTSNGRIDGINTRVDMNILNGNKTLDWFLQPSIGVRLLKNGMNGLDVEQLQLLLNKLNDANLDIDGSYGPMTKKAVEYFQCQYGLEKDGIYGQITHKKLMELNTNYELDNNSKYTSFIVKNYDVPIYTGNSNRYEIIYSVNKNFHVCPIYNDKYEVITSNNYLAINCGNKVGWINLNNLIRK